MPEPESLGDWAKEMTRDARKGVFGQQLVGGCAGGVGQGWNVSPAASINQGLAVNYLTSSNTTQSYSGQQLFQGGQK